ncbi:MAG: hypothetical protein CV089_02230 [Nitrospira sp. WS110]|nr:hypothetical protein [Nitrospira sp. WS110]
MEDHAFELIMKRFDEQDQKLDRVVRLVETHERDITFFKGMVRTLAWAVGLAASFFGLKHVWPS